MTVRPAPRGGHLSTEGSTRTARAIVVALAVHGVRDVVLCPGSRSAPLAYALVAAHDAGWLRLHVRVDERSAAFLALGLTRATDQPRPAAVVTTSGTAVANLHPAVLEAAHSGRPLLAVTADRPHELRGTGANQTTQQVGIFGDAVRWSADLPAGAEAGVAGQVARAVAAARGLRTGEPGPVHLNVAFREPLTPEGPWVPGSAPERAPRVDGLIPGQGFAATPLARGPRTVVVAGDGAGPDARALAEAAGWPLLAEPTSGSRSGPTAIGPYRLLLDLPALADDVERAIVFGHPTLSRPVSRLLARGDVEVVVVAPAGAAWTDVAGTATRVCGRVEPSFATSPESADPADVTWFARWRRAADQTEQVLSAWLAEQPLTALAVAREVAKATAQDRGGATTLVAGASMAVRDLDVAATPVDAEPVRILANRGLAGIDGTLATAAGVALGSGRPARALVGDLTFLHDLGGLACGELESEPDLQVVVVNDDGGAIFATLEHGAPRWSGVFERVFGTPQGVDLGALCAGYGVPHQRVVDLAGLRRALDLPVRGRSVVEVVLARDGLRAQRAGLADAVQAAVAGDH